MRGKKHTKQEYLHSFIYELLEHSYDYLKLKTMIQYKFQLLKYYKEGKSTSCFFLRFYHHCTNIIYNNNLSRLKNALKNKLHFQNMYRISNAGKTLAVQKIQILHRYLKQIHKYILHLSYTYCNSITSFC